MIEIKDVKDVSGVKVPVPYVELMELYEYKKNALRLYGKLEIMVLERYVQNYACFGNGGAITYEELAEMLNVELPKVRHIGVDKYLALIKAEEKEREREIEHEESEI